ncbi:hypothetical protein NYZ00_18500, partial [Acinetobacter baumannii]|nr:hypothetical protein [Acinetobacter baumannii]
QKKLSKFCCFSMYIFMATFIGLIMNSKCQQTLFNYKFPALAGAKAAWLPPVRLWHRVVPSV